MARRNALAAVLVLLAASHGAEAQQASLGSGLFDVFNGIMNFFPVPSAPPFTLPWGLNLSLACVFFCLGWVGGGGVRGAASAQPPMCVTCCARARSPSRSKRNAVTHVFLCDAVVQAGAH